QRRPMIITLFPYTTLFRSPDIISNLKESNELPKSIKHINIYDYYSGNKLFCKSPSFFFKLKSKFEKHSLTIDGLTDKLDEKKHRSEEHTSELQSRFDLVCR